MTDLSNAERLDLTSRVSYYFRQQAEDTGSPAYRNLSDHDLMATLIGDLRQYADWRGVDFGSGAAAGDAAYSQHRADEEFPYALGEEVEHRQRLRIRDFRDGDDDVPIACRGTVVSIYPERDGTQTYHIRFPGEPDPRPLKSGDIQPAPGFIRIGTSQGNLESLAEAERLRGDWRPDQVMPAPRRTPSRARHHRPGRDLRCARRGMRAGSRRHPPAASSRSRGAGRRDHQTVAASFRQPPLSARGP
jgi:hypothetical protein